MKTYPNEFYAKKIEMRICTNFYSLNFYNKIHLIAVYPCSIILLIQFSLLVKNSLSALLQQKLIVNINQFLY